MNMKHEHAHVTSVRQETSIWQHQANPPKCEEEIPRHPRTEGQGAPYHPQSETQLPQLLVHGGHGCVVWFSLRARLEPVTRVLHCVHESRVQGYGPHELKLGKPRAVGARGLLGLSRQCRLKMTRHGAHPIFIYHTRRIHWAGAMDFSARGGSGGGGACGRLVGGRGGGGGGGERAHQGGGGSGAPIW